MILPLMAEVKAEIFYSDSLWIGCIKEGFIDLFSHNLMLTVTDGLHVCGIV